MSAQLRRRALSALAVGLVLSLTVAGAADARRGGSFGSRGARTYQAPRTTLTAPQPVGPIQRSMTSPTYAPGYAPGVRPYPQQGGFLSRWGGPILGGLIAAGLFGMLAGHGFGGGGGLLALLLQIAVIVVAINLVMRLFRRRGAQDAYASPAAAQTFGMGGPQPFAMGGPQAFGMPGPQPAPQLAPNARWAGDETGLGQADFDAFERLLTEVQGAYGREDYAALRELTTPEMMSYLAEELSQNAVAGRRNDVHGVRLLSGDLSEAWSEGNLDYATVAMRYESIELMRDRFDGHVVEGQEIPTQITEIWTFVRERNSPWGGTWKLSAIQQA